METVVACFKALLHLLAGGIEGNSSVIVACYRAENRTRDLPNKQECQSLDGKFQRPIRTWTLGR